MTHGKVPQTELGNDLIGILKAISIVSNRLAQRLELVDKLKISEKVAKKKGVKRNVRKN